MIFLIRVDISLGPTRLYDLTLYNFWNRRATCLAWNLPMGFCRHFTMIYFKNVLFCESFSSFLCSAPVCADTIVRRYIWKLGHSKSILAIEVFSLYRILSPIWNYLISLIYLIHYWYLISICPHRLHFHNWSRLLRFYHYIEGTIFGDVWHFSIKTRFKVHF